MAAQHAARTAQAARKARAGHELMASAKDNVNDSDMPTDILKTRNKGAQGLSKLLADFLRDPLPTLFSSRGALQDIEQRYINVIYAEETRKRREEETEDSREETPITPDLVGSVLSKDGLMGSVPPESERVLEGSLSKRNQDHHWHPRRVVITPTTFIVLPPPGDEAGEEEAQEEVKAVKRSRKERDKAEAAEARKRADANSVKDFIPLLDVTKVRVVMTSGNTAALDELEVRNKAKASRKTANVKEINFSQNGRTGSLKRAASRVTSLAAAATFSGAEGTMADLQHKSKSGKSMMDSVKGAFKHQEDGSSEDDSAQYLLEIQTDPGGFNSGRTYTFRSADMDMLCNYAEVIQKYSQACKHINAIITKPVVEQWQENVSAFYESNPVQILVAVLIFANFIANAAQSELNPPDNTRGSDFFGALDVAFTYIFTVELVVNLLANWFWAFFLNGWSVFDLIVVCISLTSLVLGDMPGVNTLRLMRAFRVMRLFGRLQSLRQIITSLTSSIVPVGNALLIMLLVTSIYAILAVNFFSCRAPEFFGSFTKALFTLFQICTGDGWASDIVRPVFLSRCGENGESEEVPSEEQGMEGTTAMFFVSFVVLVAWTLLQVVVAVLLDNFTAAADQEKQRKAQEKAKNEGRTPVVYAIDPLLAALAHFDTSADLSQRIELLFSVLDIDDSGGLSFRELQLGLRKLKVNPPIRISEDDWDTMTLSGTMTNENCELDNPHFEIVMRRQLKLYVQRQLANAMEVIGSDNQVMSTVLFVLKLLSIGVDDISQALLSVRWREGGGGGTTRRSAVSAGDTAAENGGKAVVNRGREEGREGKTGSYNALDSIQDRLVRLEQGMGTMQAGINALLDAGKADKFALLPTQPNGGILGGTNFTGPGSWLAGVPGVSASQIPAIPAAPWPAIGPAKTPEAADGTAQSSLASPRNSLPHFEEWEREKVEDREGKTENAPKTAGGRNRNRTSAMWGNDSDEDEKQG